MKSRKPVASVSLDLDNKWAYLKGAGNPDWESYPSYFNIVVPRILDFLEQRNLKITFFVVGRDAELRENSDALWSIADAGHEIANHSHNHEPWLHSYTARQLVEEFEQSEAAIERATGARPEGFRGPGFSTSGQVVHQLIERSYCYDASTFPTFLGPVARAVFFLKTGLNASKRKERKALFGKLTDGFKSNKPSLIHLSGGRSLVEIPVTTMPVFKVPIHASYLMFLGRYSPALALMYFRVAMMLCRVTGVEPSFLLHPTDFLGSEDDADLAFFPGMNQPAQKKIALLASTMDLLERRFNVVTMREHAEIYRSRLKPGRRRPASGTDKPAQRQHVRTGDSHDQPRPVT